jgi:hypothetical protein
MSKGNRTERSLDTVAQEYFTYLGSHLPFQCASDEFYFLPRSEAAGQNLNTLDDLSPEKIRDHLRYVEGLIQGIQRVQPDDLDKETDRLLLLQSMESFAREYGEYRAWQRDPTLYLKIPLFATDHVMTRGDSAADRGKGDLLALFDQIPPLLDRGLQNLLSPTEISIQVALHMVRDAVAFYNREVRSFISAQLDDDRELLIKIERIIAACEQFKTGLALIPSLKSPAAGAEALKGILSVSFSYHRSPDEVLEIAQDVYHLTQEKLRRLAGQINGKKDWNLILYKGVPSVSSPGELMALYKKEIRSLRHFFCSQDIIPFPPEEGLAVLHTPPYLQSLRATASYRAPLTGDMRGQGVFYITPGREDLELISAHCPYLSAHETYPGHHVLDHLRIHHVNPIRRQIESPLFYEGWACYAEQLLDEYGYVREPRTRLIQLKRQLWRALRAILDVKIHTGRIDLGEAAREIEGLGFSSGRAQRQVRRFALTPGYQLCYAMGTHEILELRKRFEPKMGSKAFHEVLLAGGQLPFHLVEKRLEAWREKMTKMPNV